eukprot:4481174-Pleurochrysis_carterae.AAC.1
MAMERTKIENESAPFMQALKSGLKSLESSRNAASYQSLLPALRQPPARHDSCAISDAAVASCD